jgi:hypothetical protein
LASTNIRGRQNIGIDKTLTSTKVGCRQQNVGACADYVQVRRSISLLFWPGKVGSSWLPDLTDVLLLEDVASPSDQLQLAAKLSWADTLPHCTGSFVLAAHAEISQNIGINKISASAKLQQVISLLTGVLSKSGKIKKQRSSILAENCPKWGGGGGGEGAEASFSIQGEEGLRASTLDICSGL